jgi:hypothetical protein
MANFNVLDYEKATEDSVRANLTIIFMGTKKARQLVTVHGYCFTDHKVNQYMSIPHTELRKKMPEEFEGSSWDHDIIPEVLEIIDEYIKYYFQHYQIQPILFEGLIKPNPNLGHTIFQIEAIKTPNGDSFSVQTEWDYAYDRESEEIFGPDIS